MLQVSLSLQQDCGRIRRVTVALDWTISPSRRPEVFARMNSYTTWLTHRRQDFITYDIPRLERIALDKVSDRERVIQSLLVRKRSASSLPIKFPNYDKDGLIEGFVWGWTWDFHPGQASTAEGLRSFRDMIWRLPVYVGCVAIVGNVHQTKRTKKRED